MSQKEVQKGKGTLFTIVLPGIEVTEARRHEVLADFGKVLNGEAVAAKRDSVCVGANIGPISISHCWEYGK